MSHIFRVAGSHHVCLNQTSNKTHSTFHDVDWVGCGKNWCVHYNGSEWVQGTNLKVENLQFCEGIAGV